MTIYVILKQHVQVLMQFSQFWFSIGCLSLTHWYDGYPLMLRDCGSVGYLSWPLLRIDNIEKDTSETGIKEFSWSKRLAVYICFRFPYSIQVYLVWTSYIAASSNKQKLRVF